MATKLIEELTLANMCPYVDGTVIYKARALYSLVYDDLRTFSDIGCSDSTDTAYEWQGGCQCYQQRRANPKTAAITEGQGYSLHPNPSDGNITLVQTVPDGTPVDAEVYNSAGASIYKKQLTFSGGAGQLHVENATPGLYLIQLKDGSGMLYTLKFVIK